MGLSHHLTHVEATLVPQDALRMEGLGTLRGSFIAVNVIFVIDMPQLFQRASILACLMSICSSHFLPVKMEHKQQIPGAKGAKAHHFGVNIMIH